MAGIGGRECGDSRTGAGAAARVLERPSKAIRLSGRGNWIYSGTKVVRMNRTAPAREPTSAMPSMIFSAAFPTCGRVLALAVAGALLSLPVLAAKPVSAVSVPASAPYALFGGKPLEFERSGGKIVGVYTPNWQPTALVDALHGDSVTHVIYAFLHVCGPGQLPEDAPKCAGKGDYQLATSAIDDSFNAAFARL